MRLHPRSILALAFLLALVPADLRADDDKELEFLITVAGDTNEQPDIRTNAIKKIAEMGRKGNKAAGTLLKIAIEKANNPIGTAAVAAIGLVGRDGTQAFVKELADRLSFFDGRGSPEGRDYRSAVVNVLTQLGKEGTVAAPAIAREFQTALQKGERKTDVAGFCTSLISCLEQLPPDACIPSVPHLDHFARATFSDSGVLADDFKASLHRGRAVALMGRINSDDVVMRLKRLALSDDSVVNKAAAEALAAIKKRQMK
jgi:HEAT repeat protein